MEVEEAKIALSDTRQASIPLEWVAPGLDAAIGRPDLVSHTRQLAERIAARIKNCLAQARLSADEIDAVFLTGGSVRLAHVRKAITKAVPSARIVDGDTFGAVGKGLTLEALRRYGPGIELRFGSDRFRDHLDGAAGTFLGADAAALAIIQIELEPHARPEA